MKLRKKIISTMMLLVLVVSQFSIFGDADTRKTLSIGERQVWYADSSLNGLETGYSKFQLGGRIAFCLDYRYSLPVSGSIPTYVRRLSPKATAVLKNGYPNVTPASLGCNTVDEAYLATQLAFWNVVGITGECDSYVPLKFSNLSAADGHGDDFYRALNAAKKLAANAFNSPYNPNPSMSISSNSADIKVANGQYVAGPYKVSVKDTTIGKYNVSLNAAPASAYVTNEAGEKTSQIGANKAFYIKWDASEKGQTIKYSASAVGQKSYVSMYRNGKNGIQSVAQEEFEDVNLSANEQLSFVQKNGAIELIKHDQNSERIQGVVFELKDASGNVIGENTSDKNGVVRFSDVKPGTYTLVEKSAPSGYIKGDKPISVTVKTGETFNVKCENTKVMGSLKIVKTDDAKNVLPGVTFEILNADRVIVDKITTDANGLATSKSIPMGKYTYREVAVPNGILIDSNEYPFEINTPNEVITKNIVNTRIKGSLKVIKVDDANKPLAGVTFEILNADRVIVDTIVTDAQGNATSKELVNGKYTYRETKVPAGIIIDSKEYPFETSGNVVVKTIINKRAKGNLKIVKTDDAKKVLPGVKFEILDQDKKVVDTITTNGRGEATSKYLPVGTYTYKEVEVPNGIILDNKEYTFKLEANKTIVKNIVNQRVKGSLKIVKVDEKNTPIAGVKFEILNKDNKVVETLTTNAKGEATSKSLVIGKYSYKEISAPAGYVVDTTVYPFEVTVNSTVITKKVVNRKAKGSIEIIKV
ncbi:MAG: SpaA isopeptide-forming pilin-related protein, partial [Clostridia bacterium]